MDNNYITAEQLNEAFRLLREDNKADPAKLKFLDASYNWLSREKDQKKLDDGFNEVIAILHEWDAQPHNPLLDEPVYITGFAKLLEDIRSGYKELNLTDGEVLLIANQLVDNWVENYLKDEDINSAILEIRENPNQDEFGLELRGGVK